MYARTMRLDGRGLLRRAGAVMAAAMLLAAWSAGTAQADTRTFTYTGAEQTFVVPQGVTSITAHVLGGQGGFSSIEAPNAAGGYSRVVTRAFTVRPGQLLYIEVGGDGATGGAGAAPGGFNGGGTANGSGAGGGGGASDIRTVPRTAANSLASRLIVSGGGGGAAKGRAGAPAGAFGGNSGESGQGGSSQDGCTAAQGGGGAGTTGGSGGLGAQRETSFTGAGGFGSAGQGGGGGDVDFYSGPAGSGAGFGAGGGGGGGYYGGGGGGAGGLFFNPVCTGSAGAGGGGSNLGDTTGPLSGSDAYVDLVYEVGPTGQRAAALKKCKKIKKKKKRKKCRRRAMGLPV